MAECGVVSERRLADRGAQWRVGQALRQSAADMRDRGGLVFCLDGRDEAGGVPFRDGFGVRKFARTLGVPGDVAERFELGGEPLGRRLGAGGEQQPIRGRGVGMRHAVFEAPVAQSKGVHERLARIKAGLLQPRRLARHARSVVVEDRGLEAAQCPGAALLGRRVTEVDEDLAAALGDRIGANRVAADQRCAAREIEFPIVPVAGQHASRPDRAFAQRVAFVRAAIGDREQAALLRDHQHLFAVVPHQLAAIAAELAAFQPSRGKHLFLLPTHPRHGRA